MSSLFVGLMSGTSMDAVDAALVDIEPDKPRLIGTHSHPIPHELAVTLRELATGSDPLPDSGGTLDAQVGALFADAALALLKEAGVQPADVTAIGSHGQTIRHCPDADPPFTVQLGDPDTIAHRTGILTVADFRQADMAAGGQGAPLAPAFHAQVLRSHTENRVVLNLGGIANITVLPATGDVTGFDTGPGNTLLDAWTRRYRDVAYDEDGTWARGGTADTALLEKLLDDAYFRAPPPKSTGTEYFNFRWLDFRLTGSENPQDVQATLVALTARTVANAIGNAANDVGRVLVCGGGVHNGFLMKALGHELDPVPVVSTETAGVDPDWVEAMTFAWLAQKKLREEPGNLPSVTGAREAVVLGTIHDPKA